MPAIPLSRRVTRTSLTRSPRLVFHPLDEFLEFARFGLHRLLLLGLVVEAPEVEPARATDTSGFPSNSVTWLTHPFVDAIGQQQHLDALAAEHLEMRTVARGIERFGRDVIDLVLALLSSRAT